MRSSNSTTGIAWSCPQRDVRTGKLTGMLHYFCAGGHETRLTDYVTEITP